MGGVGWVVGAVSGSALCRVLGLRGVGAGAAAGPGSVWVFIWVESGNGGAPGPSRRLII